MSRVYILMGVSGVGKTTLGRMLAKKLSIPFYDADDFHSLSNKEKMQNGIPLNDFDRKEWLEKLKFSIPTWQNSDGGVLACSALKEKYREQLASQASKDLEWIFLYEDFSIIADRIKKRKLHFFDPDLLKSQYETLEPPNYGIHIKVDNSPEESLKDIIKRITIPEIGIIGLGVMGKSLALNLAGKNFSVSVYDPLEGETDDTIADNFIKEQSNISNLQGFDELSKFVSNLSSPRKILLMIKAGQPIDDIIEKLIPLLDQGDLIMDGGNSHYKDTKRRFEKLTELGIHFLGVGVSGGEEGALNGPSIMPGGSPFGYEMVKEILGEIAAKDLEGNPCCNYIGPGCSGHFVKMVHNGIEYGEMQLIAEFYYFMRYFQNRTPEEISEIFREWNQLENSFLLEITAHILIKKEDKEYLLDKVLDIAGQKGTGGWTTIAALEQGVSLDTITASVFARNISVFKSHKKEIRKLYKDISKEDLEISKAKLYKSFKSASIINHSIGLELLRITSIEYGWDLNLSEIARIWTKGCIIRSSFMEELAEILNSETKEHLLLNPAIAVMLNERIETFQKIIPAILACGCPMQASSSALNYFLSFTRENTSANLIQAQRDYFGAHTYQRTDKPEGEYFHSNWKPE